jgi:integrase
MEQGTVGDHLAGVDRLYKASARVRGRDDLDQVIYLADFDALETVLGGFLAELRNDATIRSVDLSSTWTSALTFVTDLMRHRGAQEGANSETMSARLVRLEHLYTQIAPRAKRETPPIRALPAAVVRELYELFDPASPRNPFRTPAQRVRNHLLFILYLHLGLRRGEALILSVNDFGAEYNHASGTWFRWLNVTTTDDDGRPDPRAAAPSLKTSQSQRQLPITETVYGLLDDYVVNWRGKTGHRFLMASQKNGPLAAQTVSDAYVTVTGALSPAAQRELESRGKGSVSPHDLRHTAAVIRLKRYKDHGIDDPLQRLRAYFGWSPTSTMPMLYARAYWQTDANEAMDLKFDAHIDALRGVDAAVAATAS